MEEADKNPGEGPENSLESGNQDGSTRNSSDEDESNLSDKVNDEVRDGRKQPQGDEEEEGELVSLPGIINLKRDLQASVTNIQTEAEAKESMRRTELEEARRQRREKLENDVKSSQKKIEEITIGWASAHQKAIPQELQEALDSQQGLCAAIIADKKELISDLQQELRARDDCFIKNLRKNEEELDLMMERMDVQIQTLTKAYAEELGQMERVYQQENEVLLTKDKTEWEQRMKKLLEKELARLKRRREEVEEYEETIRTQRLENIDSYSHALRERNAKPQPVEEQIKVKTVILRLKQREQMNDAELHKINLAEMKKRITGLERELRKLIDKYRGQERQFMKNCQQLSEEYKRCIKQYEGIKRRNKHFAAENAKQFKEMWLMKEEEVKHLAETALLVDSLISRYVGVTWHAPSVPFRELSGPVQPKKQEAETVSTDVTCEESSAVQSESGTELSSETIRKVMELMCDAAGLLIEENPLNRLCDLDQDEQSLWKLASFFETFGFSEEDLPKLAYFLINYKHQQDLQSECSGSMQDVCAESGESSYRAEEVDNVTSELVVHDHVVLALQSFYKQLMSERSARQHHSVQHLEARDASEDKAYWESFASIITDDRQKLWGMAENKMREYHTVLREVSELIPETQRLEQQNNELRFLLHQSLSSRP